MVVSIRGINAPAVVNGKSHFWMCQWFPNYNSSTILAIIELNVYYHVIFSFVLLEWAAQCGISDLTYAWSRYFFILFRKLFTCTLRSGCSVYFGLPCQEWNMAGQWSSVRHRRIWFVTSSGKADGKSALTKTLNSRKSRVARQIVRCLRPHWFDEIQHFESWNIDILMSQRICNLV